MKIDWSKFDGNILVWTTLSGPRWYTELENIDVNHRRTYLSSVRQPHILGYKCPVDPDACIVYAMYKNGDSHEGEAENQNWAEVIWFQVTRLVEGYEYE